MTSPREALRKTRELAPQTELEIMPGLSIRRTKVGVPVLRVHYSADPQRNPDIDPTWQQNERRSYTSQAAWDREQEIIDEAGGGELVYAETLNRYWDKIVITDPRWCPDPTWKVWAGFDHGKTNPSALLRCYIDYKGIMYFCGEYYMPGKEVWEHSIALREMADIRRLSGCYADPSIFVRTMQQSQSSGRPQQRAKSINDLYVERGLEIFAQFSGDASDISFAARLMEHWANLDEREPSVRIACRNYPERPVPGLHNWDCPNLLWELMRIRREKLNAQQLLHRNLSEKIVDKDNHAVDACKYLVMMRPQATEKTPMEQALEITKPLAEIGDLTSANIRYRQFMDTPDLPRRLPIIGRPTYRKMKRAGWI